MDIARKVEKFMRDNNLVQYYDLEASHKYEVEDSFNTGKNEGIQEGIQRGKNYNVPIRVDTIRRRYPIKWTCQEGIGTLIVNTKIGVF